MTVRPEGSFTKYLAIIDQSGSKREFDLDYDGDTCRSTAEGFFGHMNALKDKKELIRQKSFIYDHIMEHHNGEILPLRLKIFGRFPGDTALRQATKAFSIRENKPSLNGAKWTILYSVF